MAKARAIDAVALYEQIAAEVSSMLKQPPGIIVSKIMAMVLQAPTIGSSEAKEDVPDDRFDALAAPWARKIRAAFPAAFVNIDIPPFQHLGGENAAAKLLNLPPFCAR